MLLSRIWAANLVIGAFSMGRQAYMITTLTSSKVQLLDDDSLSTVCTCRASASIIREATLLYVSLKSVTCQNGGIICCD